MIRPASIYGAHADLTVQAHDFSEDGQPDLLLFVAVCPCGWICSDFDLLGVSAAGSAHLRAVAVA